MATHDTTTSPAPIKIERATRVSLRSRRSSDDGSYRIRFANEASAAASGPECSKITLLSTKGTRVYQKYRPARGRSMAPVSENGPPTVGISSEVTDENRPAGYFFICMAA